MPLRRRLPIALVFAFCYTLLAITVDALAYNLGIDEFRHPSSEWSVTTRILDATADVLYWPGFRIEYSGLPSGWGVLSLFLFWFLAGLTLSGLLSALLQARKDRRAGA